MKKKEKKKGKSNFSRTKNPRRLNSQMSERPRPPIVDPSHRRHIGTRHLSLSPPRESSRGWKGNREGGFHLPNATKKKKKKKNRAREMEHLRLWIDIGGGRGREKRERKKEINSTRLYRIGSFEEGQRESRCFEPSFVEGELMKLGSGYSNNGCNGCSRVHPLAGNRVERAAQMAERNGRAWKFACLRWKRFLWNIRGLSFVSRRTDPGSMEWNLLLFRNWKIIFLRKLVSA